MAISKEIKCINKSNRNDAHDRIKNVGGTGWKLPQPDAIKTIEDGTYTFWTMGGGTRVDVIIATRNGVKYLKTKNDGEQPNNLLSLPECP